MFTSDPYALLKIEYPASSGIEGHKEDSGHHNSHLHFEFKVGGAQRDPASIAALADTVALTPASRRDFSRLTQSVRIQLEAAETTRTAALFE
jgi:hypothetical protein